jgi:hypothetical protein
MGHTLKVYFPHRILNLEEIPAASPLDTKAAKSKKSREAAPE